MAQVLLAMQAEEHARRLVKARLVDVLRIGPAGRAVGRDQLGLARAPDRHADGNYHRDQAAACGNGTARVEDMRRVGVEEEPPLEQAPGVVDRRTEEVEPRRAQA